PDLAVEALEGPVAAPLDLRGDGRQGDDRAELGPAALELERGDVVLEAGVVGGQRARAQEADGAARRHQPRARRSGRGPEPDRAERKRDHRGPTESFFV